MFMLNATSLKRAKITTVTPIITITTMYGCFLPLATVAILKILICTF